MLLLVPAVTGVGKNVRGWDDPEQGLELLADGTWHGRHDRGVYHDEFWRGLDDHLDDHGMGLYGDWGDLRGEDKAASFRSVGGSDVVLPTVSWRDGVLEGPTGDDAGFLELDGAPPSEEDHVEAPPIEDLLNAAEHDLAKLDHDLGGRSGLLDVDGNIAVKGGGGSSSKPKHHQLHGGGRASTRPKKPPFHHPRTTPENFEDSGKNLVDAAPDSKKPSIKEQFTDEDHLSGRFAAALAGTRGASDAGAPLSSTQTQNTAKIGADAGGESSSALGERRPSAGRVVPVVEGREIAAAADSAARSLDRAKKQEQTDEEIAAAARGVAVKAGVEASNAATENVHAEIQKMKKSVSEVAKNEVAKKINEAKTEAKEVRRKV